MLFRKKIERSCQYCKNGALMESGQILCTKKGIVDGFEACQKFRYDPFKRIPARKKAIDFSKFDKEDFSL